MKTFVLDTNVLLHDPYALFQFQENNILIPITVIEEIDRFKKDMNETGRNARQVSRILDELRQKGSLSAGIALESGGNLRVALLNNEMLRHIPSELNDQKSDNRILAVAVEAKSAVDQMPVILVTKDTNLRIKADAIGLVAEDYESDKVDISELYSGFSEIDVSSDTVDRFYGQGWVDAPGNLLPNQYVVILFLLICLTPHISCGLLHTIIQNIVYYCHKLNTLGREGGISRHGKNKEFRSAAALVEERDHRPGEALPET